MRWYYKLPLRLRSLFRKEEAERELNDEFQFHLQHQIDEYVAQGMDAEEARYAALRSLGGMEQLKEECRETRKVSVIENLLQDLHFGLRILRRSPGFSVLAILCLTLGIGANAAVFSWIEGILFRPYPAVAHQERLLALTGTARGEPDDVSWPDFADLQRNCTLIDSFIAAKIMGTTLSIGDHAENASGMIVSANYFDALGVNPVLGRGFLPGEDSGRNAHPVTVISYRLWKDRFQGDPGIIGKTQMLNGMQHTIVGVAPEGFYGTFVGVAMQFYVPASMEEMFEAGGYKLKDRGARWIESFVRLKPGVTLQQAQEEISVVAKRLENDYPATNRGRGIRLWPLWQTPFNKADEMRATLGIMLAVVIFVLLIASANVGILLLVRSFARRQEMTVRVALGAGRGRLLQQLLTEGLILSVFATVGGLLVANWCRNLLVLFFPNRGRMSLNLAGEIDWQVIALSGAICLLATLLFGLVPAIQAGKIDLAGALKSEGGSVVGGRGKSWIRSGLVLVQVSLSFVLLVGAGLLLQSLQGIQNASLGFSKQGVLVTAVDLFSAGYDAQRAKDFQDTLLDRVQVLPGVESAALERVMPLGYIPYSSTPIAVDGYVPPPDEQPTVEYNEVGPGYLATMGIPLMSGREFSRADNETAPLVAVVNETMAARYWRGENPVGKRLQVKGRWMRVVGLAKVSTYEKVGEIPKPFFYVPLRQNFSTRTILNIRTQLGPNTMAAELTRAVHTLDPNLASYEVTTLQERVNRTTAAQQAAVTLLGVFCGLALLLAAIGLYAVMSYAVSQSNRELGLRMALGARPSNLLRLVMSRGLFLTTSGVLLGAAAALGLARLMGNLLYKVSPRDPLTFGSAFAVMALVSLAACLLPAWRAARTDPAKALRD